MKTPEAKNDYAVAVTLVILIASFVFTVVPYISHFICAKLSDDSSQWGGFGSYFGGMLSPVVAIIVLWWIIRTYNLQKEELKETRTSLNKQIDISATSALLSSRIEHYKALDEYISQCNKEINELDALINTNNNHANELGKR
jgi:prolipoprotein diacylglyceryltransferase